ncbi:MAG TPA: exopolysaccharide biosynthesis polyprenyl glycosylphosphotransferase [Azospirillum sp.]|nr:exopolysaccharide biosynthesis polyprenyl glycosylphosphotransferase [Azospirillum sp.]
MTAAWPSIDTAPPSESSPGAVARFTGVLSAVSTYDSAQAFIDTLRAGRPVHGVVSFVNQHALTLAARDPDFHAALLESDHLLRDGAGAALALRALGRDPGANLNGTDLIPALLDALRGRRVLILGTAEPWLSLAAKRLTARGIRVIGTLDGFRPAEEYAARVRACRPEIVLLAMGMPRQELVSQRLRPIIGAEALLINGGAVIDFIAGRHPRAPAPLRAVGLEWLFRVWREPRRLFARYAAGIPAFLLCLVLAFFAQRVQSVPRSPDAPARGGLATVLRWALHPTPLLFLSDVLILMALSTLPMSVPLPMQPLPMLMAVPLLGLMLGLYPGYGLHGPERMRRYAILAAATLVVTITMDIVTTAGQLTVHGVPLLLMAAVAIVAVGDALVRHALAHLPLWGRPTLIIGSGAAALAAIRNLRAEPRFGYRPVGVLSDDPRQGNTHIDGVPVLGSVALAFRDRAQRMACAAFVVRDAADDEQINHLLDALPYDHVLLPAGRTGMSVLNTVPHDLGGHLVLEVRRTPRRLADAQKRALDLAITAVALALAAPLIGFVALAIRLESPGPVLFRQKRWAGGDRTFDVLKFRTMHVDADERLRALLAADAGLRREYEAFHKLKDDPRVTRVGRFLRRTSLDELPQFLNVLKGEMSVVGPRAYMPCELPEMVPVRDIIGRVKPGITGLWQVSGRARTTFQERLAIDVYYVRNTSIWLDLHLVYRTFGTLLKADGS